MSTLLFDVSEIQADFEKKCTTPISFYLWLLNRFADIFTVQLSDELASVNELFSCASMTWLDVDIRMWLSPGDRHEGWSNRHTVEEFSIKGSTLRVKYSRFDI